MLASNNCLGMSTSECLHHCNTAEKCQSAVFNGEKKACMLYKYALTGIVKSTIKTNLMYLVDVCSMLAVSWTLYTTVLYTNVVQYFTIFYYNVKLC